MLITQSGALESKLERTPGSIEKKLERISSWPLEQTNSKDSHINDCNYDFKVDHMTGRTKDRCHHEEEAS